MDEDKSDLSSLWNQLDRKASASNPTRSQNVENKSKLSSSSEIFNLYDASKHLPEKNYHLPSSEKHHTKSRNVIGDKHYPQKDCTRHSAASHPPKAEREQKPHGSNSYKPQRYPNQEAKKKLQNNFAAGFGVAGSRNTHVSEHHPQKECSHHKSAQRISMKEATGAQRRHPAFESKASHPPRAERERKPYGSNSNKPQKFCNQEAKKELENNFAADFGAAGPRKAHVSKPLGFMALKELTTKDANQILLTINPISSPFSTLLKEQEMRVDIMALVLVALGKSCTASLNHCLGTLLINVSNNTNFLMRAIPTYLIYLRNPLKPDHSDSLLHLAVLFQKFQQTLPSSSSDAISIVLPHLKNACDKFLKDSAAYEEISQIIKEIDEQNQEFKDHHTPQEIKKLTDREKMHLIDPPENFRSIPVLPTPDDVQAPVAFLRSSIVEGKYSSVEHYLDVQYRLLREDYIRPLRDGIADYLRLKKQGKSMKNAKDVRVYTDVHVVKQDFVNGNIVHIAQFPLSNFPKLNWEYSKRFLTGSLLCFSSDDFKTMMFASIALRDPKELSKGLLLVRFEDITDEVLNISPLRTFVVIETTAYFEAYRYNLQALQELNDDNLPFKRYIVNVESDSLEPKYLDQDTYYDFRPLLIPLDGKCIVQNIDADGNIEVSYNFPKSVSNISKAVKILKDSSWPRAEELNLDHSQFCALKAALTKEFTIIQGPPGTGKTYVGLRIVQVLLHNLDAWFSQEKNSLPILVVCYTNHALDQFLEGLMLFSKRIVRIGGRGENPAVAQYQLSNLKKLASAKKEIPRYISHSMWVKTSEMKAIKFHIDIINKSVHKSSSVVLGEYELGDAIPDHHQASLKSIKNMPVFTDFNLQDDGCITQDWLGVRSNLDGWEDVASSMQEMSLDNKNLGLSSDESSIPPPEEVDDDENIGEGDIEFIEAQRDIDREEYAGVSFDIDVNEEQDAIMPKTSKWQTQGGKKARHKYIKKNLQHSVPYVEADAMKIRDVWQLNLTQSWRLYRFWLERFIAKRQVECMKYQQDLKVQYNEMKEMRTEGDIFILKRAHIVGMTTTGAAKYRDIVLRLNPQILVVEEAAEILESHIVTSLAPETQHVILIGDHQQLRPSPTVHALAVNFNLNISLFERMTKNRMECFRLSIQHRMRPEIAQLIVPSIYKDLENHESVTKFENIRGVTKNVFFITHSYSENPESDSKSKVNQHEAKFLIQLCRYFVLQGYDPSQITVLTTYTGQLFVLKKLVKDIIQKVRFTVVDNYQGEENDIILISFVRSNEEGEIGFLKISNRVCVALSRAKKGLFCIGNFGMLAEKSPLWKSIVSTLVKNGAIGSSLQLACENHPGVYSIVANEKEFESVAEGGCSRMCEYRLACGHVCSLMCHPYDRAHENIRCFKKCNKTCAKGHQCKNKCYEECGPCMHQVDKYLSACGHTIKVACHTEGKDVKCTAHCERLLPCHHRCTKLCGEACSVSCMQKVTAECPLHHSVTLMCFNSKNPVKIMESCSEPCNAVLSCGHLCRGSCSKCFQGRLHLLCNKPCNRILVCGHECKSPCSKSCPPCKQACENRCIHSRCPKTCGEPCEKCIEPCEWACAHKVCPTVCGEPCYRAPCSKPCNKLLPCKHPCIGFCGEPCPDACRVCDRKVVEEIFFGTEDDEEARFVQLEDCKHILEISGLTQWMENQPEGDKHIQLRACPKCKTVIRRNLRFGNIVKNALSQIERVKNVTYGDSKKNLEVKKALLQRVRESKEAFIKLNKELLFETWIKLLSAKTNRNIQQLTTMENVLKIFLSLASIASVLQFKDINADVDIKLKVAKLCDFTAYSLKFMLSFIQDEFLTASEQQLEQLTWEVHRYKLSSKFLDFICGRTIKQDSLLSRCLTFKQDSLSEFYRCVDILTKYQPFQDKDSTEFSSSYQNFVKSEGSAVINVSELEKESILKAMGLSRGHWYQCPNGHVYCITECGGAMQIGRCNECNAQIGGQSHTLLGTNRVATDMDGSRHSAWSAAANMANYEF